MTATSLTACLSFWCALSAQCLQPVIPDDAGWDYRFALPGVQGNVMAMAFDKKLIYVGGSMQSIGSTVVEGVASIDGKKVTALPEGPKQNPSFFNVTDLEMFQDRLCVAGYFTNLANQPAGGFGVWDGNGWEPLEITNGYVFSLEPDDKGGLLAAGRFFLPGGKNPVALARWNGKGTWEDFNSELPPCDDEVCIEAAYQPQAISDGNVVVTLHLTFNRPSPSLPSSILARCDADKNWHNMPGPNGDPAGLGNYVLGKFQGQAVAGGAFSNAANSTLRNIALWDGTAWQPIGGGLENQVFAVVGNERVLYAATYFTGNDGFPRSRILRWQGKEWERVGTEDFRGDLAGRLYLRTDDELYYSNFASGSGSVVAPNLIRWNGKQWEPVLKGNFQGISDIVPVVWSMVEHGGQVCIGGRITTAGGVYCRGIAVWDDHAWHSLGGGIQGPAPTHAVRALASFGHQLVAGGVFTNMGGMSCSNIARWDGHSWNALGSGINGQVFALTPHNNSLVVGGRFTHAGSITANNIASWNGSEWQPLGSGCSSNVSALISWQGDIYAGGRFLTAGGVGAPRIARWSGTGWQGIGAISGRGTTSVNAFAATPEALYIGGAFTNAGGKPIHSLARWDGTNWTSVGGGWPGTVNALAVRGNNLFVGGNWTNASGQTVDAIKCWNGTNWLSLGSGITDSRGNQRVSALLSTSDSLWVGGRFVWAGGKPSANIARWIETPQLGMVRRFDKSHKRGMLDLHFDAGLRGRIETSTNLLNWTALPRQQNESPSDIIEMSDAPGQWFYRAVFE